MVSLLPDVQLLCFVDGGTNDLRTDIESKQPALTVGAGINIASNPISFNPASVTSTVNFSCTGEMEQ